MSCDFLALAAAGVKGLTPYQPGKPVEELQRELGLIDVVKLASNENPLGVADSVKQALTQGVSELHRYPDANGFELKTKLQRRFAIEANCLTLGNGSNDVLELIARALLTPADEVIYSQYAFLVYPLVAQALGAKAVVTPAKDWGHDLQAMAAAINEQTKLIFIANPNNPTGTWLDYTALTEFLDQVPEDVVVVLDEAYTEYVERADFPNGLALLPRYSNLVVTRTFSKAYGLAGLRIGYAAANAQLTDLFNRVRQPFNANQCALHAASAVLDDQDYLQRSVSVNQQGMQQLTAGLDQLGLAYIPSVGNFVCVNLARDAGAVYQALLAEGVIVRPVANYGMPQHLRISIGLAEENSRCLAALKKVLSA